MPAPDTVATAVDGRRARTLDGSATAAAVKTELALRVARLRDRGVIPGLGTILVGDDPGSQWYVAGKHRDCAEIGIASFRIDLPASATQGEIEAFRDQLIANPSNYIAQPTLALSTCPTYVESGIAPRHIDLRPFVLSGKTVQMVPGGLTRVALKEGSLVVNSSQGGGTKDTWVLEV